MAADNERPTVAVVSVHGTNDGAASDAGAKWWQEGSSFAVGLEQALRGRGIAAELHAFRWSGANSALARAKGARALAATVRRLSRRHDRVHIVAHSHGGNVANIAADRLRWGSSSGRASLASVTAVGTPFIRRRVSWFAQASAVLFLLVSILASASWVLQVGPSLLVQSDAVRSQEFWFSFAVAAGVIVFAMGVMMAVASEGLNRVFLPNPQLRSHNSIFAIRHPQDEAIAFLQQVDAMELEPIPAGALWRGSARLAGALSAFVASVGVLSLLVLSAVSGDRVFGDWRPTHDLWLAPLVFCLLYPLLRLALGLAPEFTLRGALNRRITNVVRGVALGADGVQRLGEISTRSHTLPTVEAELSAEVVERMRQRAAAQSARLIEKYRWPLLTAGADAQRALGEIATDALTWDSLIHTTYFDQLEIVEAIADHISSAINDATQRPSGDRR